MKTETVSERYAKPFRAHRTLPAHGGQRWGSNGETPDLYRACTGLSRASRWTAAAVQLRPGIQRYCSDASGNNTGQHIEQLAAAVKADRSHAVVRCPEVSQLLDMFGPYGQVASQLAQPERSIMRLF